MLRVARRLGPLYAVWINDLALVDILDLTTAPTLYDVTDDWLAARRTQTESARLARSEARLLAETATVTVCSPALAHDKGSVRPDVVVVTNGVDSAAYTGPVERPRDLGEGPVALYVGTLHADRLDVDLCARTARALRRSGGRLVLVGPDALEGRERHLLEEAGVHLLGAKPFSEIPAYTRSADVLVVPHVVDQFTDSLDPIKLYEYRAARRPVVSTRVAGFRDSRDVLVEAVSSEQFPAHVVAVTARPVPDQRQIRVPDDLPTWDRQAAVMHEVIRATVAPRDARP
ncbi:glycosyltransferase [Isoptericola chiayiensis]|uniref:glycosyltransferase n=1 Tax=Isoptericola chiayiensis TaxID=579446 RepID=UPI0031B61C8C|nr:glycosyltransferase involved in cell wall biosynthesis [Isoptericola chiayiensis]